MTDSTNTALPGEQEGEHRLNRAFAGVGAALGLAVWLYLFSFPLGIASHLVGRTHPRWETFLGFLSMLTVVPGMVWVAKSAWGSQWRRAFPLKGVGLRVLLWTALCVLALLSLVLAWAFTVDRLIGLPDFPNPLTSVGVLGLLLGAPIAEEALCRGYGLARIRELAGDRRALLFTAAMFALLHGSWVKLPGTFILGLLLGWLVLQTGSLWPAFLGHFVNNASALALDLIHPVASLDPKRLPWALILGLGTASTTALALLGSPWIRRRVPELNTSS